VRAGFGGCFNCDDVVELELDLAAFEHPNADLRALEVSEDADGRAGLFFGGADRCHAAGMIFAGAMAEVQPEAIDASLNEHGQPLRRITGRAHRGDDLTIACAHAFSVGQWRHSVRRG
jgi:hypothetical protein